jgi:hypothetical protein
MAERREPSRPPSDPHPALARGGSFLGGEDRPVRLQLVGALLLGLVLVASGLYLWRRPRAPADTSSAEPAASMASPVLAAGVFPGDAGAASAAPDAGGSGVALSDARVLVCQDRGSKKTAPDQCDHVASLEQALSSAISQAGTCATSSAGTIEYIADVSFARHKVSVSMPRAGRSVRDRKALRACSTAVRGAMQTVALDGIDHQHSRYKIAITATYKGG